jgi:hypothetical protein
MRLALAVGCNSYDSSSIPTLDGAESDAQRIFGALTNDELGGYSPEHSILLLSPTLSELREALRRLLSNYGSIDTFTFYFAGHGSVKSGSFYMWGRDVIECRLSMTALSLGDIFRMIAEVGPKQTNIIVDACEGGGLINDLGVLLKNETLGDAHTPGVTLFATAAQNEFAMEEDGVGRGTSALLDCIEGREFVQDHAAALDLVEISRRVSNKLRASGQTPVVWGLNLSAAPQFCRNPFYSETPIAMQVFVKEWSVKSTTGLTRTQYEALWSIYSSIESNWNPRSLANTVQPIFSSMASDPELLANFVLRLSDSLSQRADSTTDRFRSVEVGAVLAVSLLPFLGSAAVAKAAQRIVDEVSTQIAATINVLIDALDDDPFALLASENAFPELYLLPIRITKTLAWTAIPVLIRLEKKSDSAAAVAQFGALVGRLRQTYRYSITPVSDMQASHWYILLSALHSFGLSEEADEIAGIAFYRLVANQGNLLRANATGAQIVDYILSVDAGDFSKVVNAVERPNETLTVLLRLAPTLGLADVFDESLWRLDGVNFMAYVNPDYSRFGDEVMHDGENLVWEVGYDIFRVPELASSWPEITPPTDHLGRHLSLMAALLYPDRVPWHYVCQ